MPVHNAEIAELLDIQGANAFRIRAYLNAALKIREFGREIGKRLPIQADWLRISRHARHRGWLSADDVLNSRSLRRLRPLLRQTM